MYPSGQSSIFFEARASVHDTVWPAVGGLALQDPQEHPQRCPTVGPLLPDWQEVGEAFADRCLSSRENLNSAGQDAT